MDGVINFFKPIGMTSHDAVYFFRRLLGIKKIGHTGTLDPMAAGVLPICIGKATRISEYISDSTKEYIGELTLGTKTDTLDSSGVVIESSEIIASDLGIADAFARYKGSIMQLPPMYSAKKINGKRLYEIAREGKKIERKPREIYVHEMEILQSIDSRKIIFRTKCSKGTYIRTICDDIGDELKTHGHMSFLLRTAVGSFNINQSLGMETLSKLSRDNLDSIVLPIDKALGHFPSIVFDQGRFTQLSNGLESRPPMEYSKFPRANPMRVYAGESFVGIGVLSGEGKDTVLKMEKVLTR